MKQVNAFTNLARAERRALHIVKATKHWDNRVPVYLYNKWVVNTPWVDNYSWLTENLKVDTPEDVVDSLHILDAWAGAINRWCDNNIVDNSPYCVRTSAKEFLNKRIANYTKLG